MRVPGVRFVQGRNSYGTSTKYGIAVHATANTAPARNEATYAQSRTDGTSSHFYIDAIEVIQSLDTADCAGHAGSDEGNTYAIALEFTGLNSWSRAKWLADVAWEKTGAMLAAVSKAHGIPATRATVAQMKANARVRGAYDHNQMRQAWGGTDHTDPGPNFPWDELLRVWQGALNGQTSGDDDMQLSDRLKNGKTVNEGISDTADRTYILMNTTMPQLMAMVEAVGKAANIDPAELASIREAAKQGATQAMADNIRAFADAVVAALPEGDGQALTRGQVVEATQEAMRQLLGGLNDASPQG